MPWIRSFRHLGIWVAFTDNDYHTISCVSFGVTQGQAESRCYRKLDKRDAARGVPCPTCDGMGTIGFPDAYDERCPTCHGIGVANPQANGSDQ